MFIIIIELNCFQYIRLLGSSLTVFILCSGKRCVQIALKGWKRKFLNTQKQWRAMWAQSLKSQRLQSQQKWKLLWAQTCYISNNLHHFSFLTSSFHFVRILLGMEWRLFTILFLWCLKGSTQCRPMFKISRRSADIFRFI